MKLAKSECYLQCMRLQRHEFYQEAEWIYRDLTNPKDVLPSHIVQFIKTLLNKTDEKLECPICLTVIPTEKIEIARCGHAFCNDCMKKINQCAMCRRPLNEIYDRTY